MYYAIFCEDTADSFEKRRSVRQAHLANLETLNHQNRLLLAGPLLAEDAETATPNNMKGSLIIADFETIEEAKAWIAADPYTTAEVFARITVKPFKKVYPE